MSEDLFCMNTIFEKKRNKRKYGIFNVKHETERIRIQRYALQIKSGVLLSRVFYIHLYMVEQTKMK